METTPRRSIVLSMGHGQIIGNEYTLGLGAGSSFQLYSCPIHQGGEEKPVCYQEGLLSLLNVLCHGSFDLG